MRINWDEYFLSFLPIVSQRSTCDRGRAASIIVRDNMIVSTGYAGSPPGAPHCDKVGHLLIRQMDDNGMVSDHCIRTQHSEMNCIAQAAKIGLSINNSTIYITMEPCFSCAKMIVQCGIKRVVCLKKYHKAELSRQLFKDFGIEFIVINNKVEKYE